MSLKSIQVQRMITMQSCKHIVSGSNWLTQLYLDMKHLIKSARTTAELSTIIQWLESLRAGK